FIQFVGELANLRLDGGIAVEIGGRRQRAREEECRIDGRKFALPSAAARFNVKKMVEEPPVTGSLRFWTLRALEQVSQSPASDLCGEFAYDDAAFHVDRSCCQGHAKSGDACRSGRIGLVADEPVVRVRFMQVVQERSELEPTEVLIGRQSVKVGVG